MDDPREIRNHVRTIRKVYLPDISMRPFLVSPNKTAAMPALLFRLLFLFCIFFCFIFIPYATSVSPTRSEAFTAVRQDPRRAFWEGEKGGIIRFGKWKKTIKFPLRAMAGARIVVN